MNCFTLCRLCLSSNYDFLNIFSEKSMGDSLNQKLFKYLSLEVKEEDSLPHIICVKCFEKIEHFHEFCEQVQSNQGVLLSLVQPVLNVIEKNNGRNLVPSDFIKIEALDLNNELTGEDGTVYKIGAIYKLEENLNGISMVETNTEQHQGAGQSSLIVLKNDLEKAQLASCNEAIELVAPCSRDETVKMKPSRRQSTRKSENEFVPDLYELKLKGESDTDEIDEELIDSDSDDDSIFNLDETAAEDVIDKPIIESTIKNFPTEIIKGSRLVVRGKELMALMSKFYRLECKVCTEKRAVYDKLQDLCTHYNDVHATKGYVMCCDLKLIKPRAMAMHMSRHLQPEAFRCHVCNKMMTCPKILQYHIQNHLPEEKRPLACPECPRRFSYSSALVAHSLIHQPENARAAHICDECGKSFLSGGRLSTHMSVVHTKHEQAYICHICAKKFSCKGNLAYHLTTHQPKLHQVQCEQCGKWLKNKLCLRKHMIQHSSVRYTCDLCTYSTLNLQRLRNHKKIQHSDTKPFSCDVCDKTFKIKNNLTNHMVMHTGVKKFQCEFCSRTFASSGNYYSHRKRMHPNELAQVKLKKEEEEEKMRENAKIINSA